MLSNIWFNGVSARDMGIRDIEHYPDLNRPARKHEAFDVPGRSGQIVFVQDVWENVEREYDIFAGEGKRGTAQAPFKSIAEWLNSPGGYAKLEDTYEPEIFRLATCLDGFEVENNFSRFGRATITFNCRPERFLKSGAAWEFFESYTGSVRNPTAYAAKPLIRLLPEANAGDTTLTVTSGSNVYTVNISGADANRFLYIDCETMNAYYGNGEDGNSVITCTEFPKLEGNEVSTIATASTAYEIQVMPRWFYI